MKKLLVVLAVLALVASSAFAGVVTLTKEKSQADYPGVLTLGSINGTETFVSDLGLLANSAVMELDNSSNAVLLNVVTNSDFGTLGLSLGAIPNVSINGLTVASPLSILGLSWATKGDIKIGAKLQYGLNTKSYVNNKVPTYIITNDQINETKQFIGAKGSVGLKNGLDLALILGYKGNNSYLVDNWNDTNKRKNLERTIGDMLLGVTGAGRLDLGNGMKTYADVTYVMSSNVTKTAQDTNNDGTKEVDTINTDTTSELGANVLLGKDIKATESLVVKLAAGVGLKGYATKLNKAENKLANTKVYSSSIDTTLNINVPIYLAVEGKLNETWGFTAGAKTNVITTNSKSHLVNEDTTKDTFKDYADSGDITVDPAAANVFTFGVNGKIGDFMADIYINKDIFKNGPFFISGSPTAGLGLGAAITYNWK